MVTLFAIKFDGGKDKSSDVVRFRYGMFTDGYRNTHTWWETIVALRKALVICISVFLSTYGALVQAYVGVLVVSIFLTLQMAQKPYTKPVLNNLETFGMGACLVTLYAGMLFFNRFLACPNNSVSCPLLDITEVIVIGINATFLLYAFGKLSLEYALHVSDSKLFMRFIICYFKMIGICFTLSVSNRKQIEMLHKKLQRSAHNGLKEVLFIQKFKRKSLKKTNSKINGKNGNIKVFPTTTTENDGSVGQRVWGNNDSESTQKDEIRPGKKLKKKRGNTIRL